MTDKVSIIVPIYNVEKYLKQCVDSILRQTYKNLEIILVEDGSPDACASICDTYAQIDKRVKVIHKKNGGLSDARNVGIEIATGKWIAFVDSDDTIATNYIQTLLEITEKKSDIGIVLPYYVYEDSNKKEQDVQKQYIKEYTPIEALKVMFYQKEFDTSAWGKIFKRELFTEIRFPVGKLYEDISTIYKVFLKSKKIVYSNCKLYFYLQRKDSIMGRSFKIKDLDYIYESQKMLDDIVKLNDIELSKAARCRYLNANFSILLKLKKNKKFKEEKLKIKNNIAKYRKEVLLDSSARIKTKVAIILTYFNLM